MNKFKRLGPGLLFAGAAIGVSHLVYSTRAGADYGWGLLWAFLIINIFKYPFFEFGPRYAVATGETLLDGYKKIGKNYLWFYAVLNTANMFTIQAAVTIVTAGLAAHFFGISANLSIWGSIIIIICSLLLVIGKYSLLDKLMKFIIIILSFCTFLALILAFYNSNEFPSSVQVIPEGSGLLFLIAFMGWMPAPMDISIWHSIWSVEKQKNTANINLQESLFDFNVGYGFTAIIVAFLGRLNPIGILFAGLLMALTYVGGEISQFMLGIPAAAIQVFQGMLLFFLLSIDLIVKFRLSFTMSKPTFKEE